MTGSLNMEDLRSLLPPLYASRVVKAAFVFILFGFAIKIALFPAARVAAGRLHLCPFRGERHPVHRRGQDIDLCPDPGCLLGVHAGFRSALLPIFDILCWAAALAMIAGSVFAIVQNNFKKMLAYSSVANVGYIVLAVGLAPDTTQGLTPAIVHIVNHAVIKACMFMTACAFIYRFDLWDIRQFEGLGRKHAVDQLRPAAGRAGHDRHAAECRVHHQVVPDRWRCWRPKKYHFVVVILVSTLLMIVYFWRLIEIIYVRCTPGRAKASVRIPRGTAGYAGSVPDCSAY